MTNERVVCVYAMAGLKRNSTRLLVVMCIGIALALYGVYVQARSQSNPNYMPTIAVATNWFYENLGQRIAHPSSLLKGCASNMRQPFKPTVGQLIMHRFIYPVTRFSGILNGAINVAQIILLKVLCKSFTGTDSIIALSALGVIVSMLCLIGSFASCKLMCISCLGIHHVVIIYLAMRRRRILKNILCPTESTNPIACTFGASSNTTPMSNSITALNTTSKHANSCTTRRRTNGGSGNSNGNGSENGRRS